MVARHTFSPKRNIVILPLKNYTSCYIHRGRIGHAIESYSEHILDESMVYDEAASSEEERSSSIRKMLSRVVNLNNNAADAAAADNDDNDNNMIVSNGGEEDSAIQW